MIWAILIFGVLSIILGISFYFDLMDTNKSEYDTAIDEKNWPFSIPPGKSFNHLYVKIKGFQDLKYFISFHGDADEIRNFTSRMESMRNYRIGLSSINEISEINQSLESLDRRYREHGWDLGKDPTSTYVMWKNTDGNGYYFLTIDGTKLYYCYFDF
jgi:hypothetical protein